MKLPAAIYCRVSSAGQADTGISLSAQEAMCRRRAKQRVLAVGIVVREQASTRKSQPELEALLDRMDAGEFGTLLVAKWDRLARNPPDLYDAMDRSARGGWGLCVLDLDVDTSTPLGRAMAGVAAVFARLDRDMIGVRTRDAIAERKRLGIYRGHLRPQSQRVDAEHVEKLLELHRSLPDASLSRLAGMLDALGLPPMRGESWSRGTVDKLLDRHCDCAAHTARRAARTARQRERAAAYAAQSVE